MIHSTRDRLSEDLFADTRMPFGEHLEELRMRLWRAIVGFACILVACLLLDLLGYLTGTGIGVGRPVMDLICRPVEQELQQFYDRRKERALQSARASEETQEAVIELDIGPLAERLGLPGEGRSEAGSASRFVRLPARFPPGVWVPMVEKAQRLLGERPSLKTFSATEAMMVYFQVAIFCGVVLGSPWILWQLWSFVAAGLHPHEKRLVHVYLPFSVGLFLAGVLFCQFLVMPQAVAALLGFNEWLGFQPDLRLSEWLSFAVVMPLVFGVSFQTPLVMRLAERLGMTTIDAYRSKRRLAWFLMAVIAAVVTPGMDVLTLLLLWIPMGFLYELGILLCWLSPGDLGPIDLDLVEETTEV